MHGRSAAVVILHACACAYAYLSQSDDGRRMMIEEGSSFHLPVTPPAVPEFAEERREHYRAMEAKDLVRHRRMVETRRQARQFVYSNTSTFELPMRSALNVVNVGMYLVNVGMYLVTLRIGTPPQPFSMALDTASDLTWLNCRLRRRKRIGTPPQPFSMALDTASDLTWLNCRLRRRKGKHPGRPHVTEQPKTVITQSLDPEGTPAEVKVVKNWYRPALSSSWRRYSCSERDTCGIFPHNLCQSPDQMESCAYEQTYQAAPPPAASTARRRRRWRSLAAAVGRAKSRALVLGCSTFEAGPNVQVHDGVLTLGNSIISFGTIAGQQFASRFSFCLLPTNSPLNASSYLTFGPNPAINGPGTMETKVVYNTAVPAFGACITGIFVGDELLDIPREVWDHNITGGGLNIDTGTSLTGFVELAYKAVTKALHRHLAHLERTELNGFDFCYKWTEHNVTIPKFVIEFEGGARLEPDAKSVVMPEVVPGVACLAFRLLELGPGIIGNVQMQEHIWEIDHLKEKLRFKKDKCHNHPQPLSSSSTATPTTH